MINPKLKFSSEDNAMKLNYLFPIILSLVILITLSACGEDSDVEVYISTGEKQCLGGGLSITEAEQYLLDAGIEVKEQSCGELTQMNFISVCGGEIGEIYVFTIDANNSNLAENIGFTVPSISAIEDDYQTVECEQ